MTYIEMSSGPFVHGGDPPQLINMGGTCLQGILESDLSQSKICVCFFNKLQQPLKYGIPGMFCLGVIMQMLPQQSWIVILSSYHNIIVFNCSFIVRILGPLPSF